MTTTLNDWIKSDPENARLFAQEQLIVAVAERIWEQMEERHLTKSEIAAALGKSKAFVTQLLDGKRNMTLRTLSDIAFALGVRCEVRFRAAMQSSEGWSTEVARRVPTAVVCEHSIPHNAAEAAKAVVHLPEAA